MRLIRVLFFVGMVSIVSCGPANIYNAKARKQYLEVYNRMPQTFKSEGNINSNFMITRPADFRDDTLNKADTVPATVHIVSVTVPGAVSSAKSDRVNDADAANVYVPMMNCSAIIRGDTLILKMDDVFRNTQISHTIIKGKVTTTYHEFERDSPVFKTSPQSKPADSITVKAKTIHFELSSDRFDNNGKLYGKAEIETEPYYIKSGRYKHGYIKKRLRAKYVFVVSR